MKPNSGSVKWQSMHNWIFNSAFYFSFSLFSFTPEFHFVQQPWRICVGSTNYGERCPHLDLYSIFTFVFVFWCPAVFVFVFAVVFFPFHFEEKQPRRENMCRKLQFMQHFAHTWILPLFSWLFWLFKSFFMKTSVSWWSTFLQKYLWNALILPLHPWLF